jgi:branched-chain amino acid transport system substrate-binding protein
MMASATTAKAEMTIAVIGASTGAGAIPSSVAGLKFGIDALNDQGGLLGQQLHVEFYDDRCEADQGEAVARRALTDHPVLILGHECSAPSIRAAPLYAAANVIQITTASTNVALTAMHIKSVFRMIGRDDRQSAAAAALIARRWKDSRIGVVDDGAPYGKGLADSLQRELAARHIPIRLTHSFTMGADSYRDLVGAIAQAKLDVLYDAGYSEDIGLLLHELRADGLTVQVICGDPGMHDSVPLAAGAATEGLLFTYPRDPMLYPAVRTLVLDAYSKGVEMNAIAVARYAAIQVWSQAVREVNSFDFDKVVDVLHSRQFDTVLGRIGFDANGDVIGERGDWIWYRWHNGKTEPVEE